MVICAAYAKRLKDNELTRYEKKIVDVHTICSIFNTAIVCTECKDDWPLAISRKRFEPYLLSDDWAWVSSSVVDVLEGAGYDVVKKQDKIVVDIPREEKK